MFILSVESAKRGSVTMIHQFRSLFRTFLKWNCRACFMMLHLSVFCSDRQPLQFAVSHFIRLTALPIHTLIKCLFHRQLETANDIYLRKLSSSNYLQLLHCISRVTNYTYNRGFLNCLLYREISRQTLWQFCNFTCEIIN